LDDAATRADTATRTYSLYFTDTLSVTPELALTLSGRYDHTDVQTRDRSGLVPALTGTHGYARFNPSAGLTYRLRRGLGTYLSYGESARVPTPVELTCADPSAPCRLPNAFLADPQLAEVVARDVEAGMRGEIEAQFLGRIDWHLGGFNTITSQDIL